MCTNSQMIYLTHASTPLKRSQDTVLQLPYCCAARNTLQHLKAHTSLQTSWLWGDWRFPAWFGWCFPSRLHARSAAQRHGGTGPEGWGHAGHLEFQTFQSSSISWKSCWKFGYVKVVEGMPAMSCNQHRGKSQNSSRVLAWNRRTTLGLTSAER